VSGNYTQNTTKGDLWLFDIKQKRRFFQERARAAPFLFIYKSLFTKDLCVLSLGHQIFLIFFKKIYFFVAREPFSKYTVLSS